jgi:hypothetical protein
VAMDHDAVADSHLPVLIRAGGEVAPCTSPPVIGPLLKHQEIQHEPSSSH